MRVSLVRVAVGLGAASFVALAACVGDDPVTTSGDGGSSSGAVPEAGVASSSSSSGELTADAAPSGSSSSGDTADAAPELPDGATASACEGFCTRVQARCTGPNAQFDDEPACLTECMQWAVGEPGDDSGDTLACRLYFVDLATDNPDVHCAHAGRDSSTCEE